MKNDTTHKKGTSQPQQDNVTERAHMTAERDMAKDPDLVSPKKNNDLDEGELARLGGDKNDLA